MCLPLSSFVRLCFFIFMLPYYFYTAWNSVPEHVSVGVLLLPSLRHHVSPFTGDLSQSMYYRVLKTRQNTKLFFIYKIPFSIRKKLNDKQAVNGFFIPLDLCFIFIKYISHPTHGTLSTAPGGTFTRHSERLQ